MPNTMVGLRQSSCEGRTSASALVTVSLSRALACAVLRRIMVSSVRAVTGSVFVSVSLDRSCE